MHYLALCCIAKDEDPFLKEWLAYHALLGVEHFYIYDNGSKNLVRHVLGAFADSSRVTIRRVTGHGKQLPVYSDCLQSFGNACRWIGFIDIDEFICPLQDNDIRVFLSEFEQYAGVAATWHLFNSSGHLGRPQGPVIRQYTQAFVDQESFHVKSFVDPARTLHPLNPHVFAYPSGEYCVNEDHYPLSPDTQWTFANGRRMRINHYFMRSQQDFADKLARGLATSDDPGITYEWVMFYQGVEKPYVTDTAIQRFLPPLERALAADAMPKPFPRPSHDAAYEDVMETALKFLDVGQFEKALVCLCSCHDTYKDRADFWTLRALVAQAAAQYGRADVFIRQSIMREASLTGYRQLQSLLAHTGQSDLAANVAAIVQRHGDTLAR